MNIFPAIDLYGGRAEDHARDAAAEVAIDALHIAHAAANLDK